MTYPHVAGSEKEKIPWGGKVTSIQARIRLTRSFDQRSHSYQGYVLHVQASVAGKERTFAIGIGKGAQEKHHFRTGDFISGKSEAVQDPRTEVAEYYKTSELKLNQRGTEPEEVPPPWHGSPPDLEIYRQRGHRRLDAHTYESKCGTCIWGCRMPVEMIIDQWNPIRRQHRFETFCYGPKSCSFYKVGPTRKVPGRKGMVWVEEDWIDEEAVSHRGVDD